MPICDIVTKLIGKMSDDRFRRSRKAIGLIEDGHKLTSRAFSALYSYVLRSNNLQCEREKVAMDGKFTCIERRSPDKAAYRVRMTPSYTVECPCRHYEKMLRPCDHAAAAVKAASTTGGSTRSGTSRRSERRRRRHKAFHEGCTLGRH